ncbi:hypothetical protein F4778DRAFT_767791 [Xylariomycetidae sp. FL2044]|nr:hypothetical protein F4778DRAFT_767791 [Xylariomycetidae sp. FL2044]
MLSGHSTYASGYGGGARQTRVTLLRDSQACIPLTKILGDGDIVVLLTPVVAPLKGQGNDSNDPFEPLGRALAARHPWIRHVPYTSRNGMTDTHVGFLKRAKIVIFVISGKTAPGQSSQVDIAQIARLVGEQRPQIVVACWDVQDLGLMEADFPTIVQLPGYLPPDLQDAAAVLFGESTTSSTSGVDVPNLMTNPKFWPIENWEANPLSIGPVQELWNQCLPAQFHLEKPALQSILQRDGYSMHFVVRLPETGEVIGFCATYTTFVDKAGERLIGSLAMLIVNPSYRRRGIGLSLYQHARSQLVRTRGVDRIQLGSTFPRLLSGVPSGFLSEEWFRRREWRMDGQAPGCGQDIYDWVLNIEDWPRGGGISATSTRLIFQPGTFEYFEAISNFVEMESTRQDHAGWYDQYMHLLHDNRLEDIILGLEGSEVVASALIYTPHNGSTIEHDLPWARSIGPNVGGVTCICIADQNPAISSSKDTIMIRLLDKCVSTLEGRGMQHVFLDAIKGGYEGFQSMGFQKWAKYRDLWQSI